MLKVRTLDEWIKYSLESYADSTVCKIPRRHLVQLDAPRKEVSTVAPSARKREEECSRRLRMRFLRGKTQREGEKTREQMPAWFEPPAP